MGKGREGGDVKYWAQAGDKIALVFGNESEGVSQEFIDKAGISLSSPSSSSTIHHHHYRHVIIDIYHHHPHHCTRRNHHRNLSSINITILPLLP